MVKSLHRQFLKLPQCIVTQPADLARAATTHLSHVADGYRGPIQEVTDLHRQPNSIQFLCPNLQFHGGICNGIIAATNPDDGIMILCPRFFMPGVNVGQATALVQAPLTQAVQMYRQNHAQFMQIGGLISQGT